MRLVALLTLTMLAFAPPALAKCAPSAEEGTSSNGRFKVVPKVEGTFELFALTEKKDWEKKQSGALELPGHHVKTLVADDGGHFVLYDEYGGLSIHEANGKRVRWVQASELLTEAEKKDAPGKWACHPEGKWSTTLPTFVEKKLHVVVHSGRAIDLDLAAEEWVVEGKCDTPDNVKAHGGMNCLGVDWTCPRCHKAQKGLQWRICTDCCKELGVCIVCNKKR